MNPYIRVLVYLVAASIAIHVAWVLIAPALPFLMGVVFLIVLLAGIRWWRNRL